MVHSSTWLGHFWVYEDFCCSRVTQDANQQASHCTKENSSENCASKVKQRTRPSRGADSQALESLLWEDKAERRAYYREGTSELSSEERRKAAVEAILLRLSPLSNCVASEGLTETRCTGAWLLDGYSQLQTSNDVLIDWTTIPAAADPARGSNFKATASHHKDNLAEGRMERGERKRWQVTSMAAVLTRLQLPDGAIVADFGCGSGALCLPLAALFPHLSFVGIDWKQRSIHLLRTRAQEAGLRNVRGWCGGIEDFSEPFDACVALHACGTATDLAHLQAMKRRAAYIFSPCCVGKLQKGIAQQTDATWQAESGSTADDVANRRPEVAPRSVWLRAHCSGADMALIAQTADWSCYDHNSSPSLLHAICKAVVETDRNEAAQERGYNTHLMRLLHPQSGVVGTGDILVGTVGEDKIAPHVRSLAQWGAGSSPLPLSFQLGAQH